MWEFPTKDQALLWIIAGAVTGLGGWVCVFIPAAAALTRLPSLPLPSAVLCVSVNDLLAHTKRWFSDDIQTGYVWIVATPPIFALCAMGALIFPLCHPMFIAIRTR